VAVFPFDVRFPKLLLSMAFHPKEVGPGDCVSGYFNREIIPSHVHPVDIRVEGLKPGEAKDYLILPQICDEK
jgi:hypothetical protein